MISFIFKSILTAVLMGVVATLGMMYLMGFEKEALVGFGIIVVLLVGQKLVFRRGS